MPQAQPATDRREGFRFSLNLPICIEAEDSEWIPGETRDVSTGGFLLYCSAELRAGRRIQYIVSVPEFGAVNLRCVGKVQRTSADVAGGVIAAVTMDECVSVEHGAHLGK
jgi:hypothetical protein